MLCPGNRRRTLTANILWAFIRTPLSLYLEGKDQAVVAVTHFQGKKPVIDPRTLTPTRRRIADLAPGWDHDNFFSLVLFGSSKLLVSRKFVDRFCTIFFAHIHHTDEMTVDGDSHFVAEESHQRQINFPRRKKGVIDVQSTPAVIGARRSANGGRVWTRHLSFFGSRVIFFHRCSIANPIMTALSSKLRHLVACNVYVSTGGQTAASARILTSLLQRAQDRCYRLAASETASRPSQQESFRHCCTVVVHAYADKVYDRSSFHLAGTVVSVADVAKDLAVTAIREIGEAVSGIESAGQISAHPYIGLVDHIAVMPLESGGPTEAPTEEEQGPSWAARSIGRHLEEQTGVKVFLYGEAHPDKTPLATVRRRQTNFFQSGGLSSPDECAEKEQAATVGAPEHFVENYNILLTNNCTKALAQSLTRQIRERDGGLPGVEALTLPYSEGRYEVACNLRRPDLTGTEKLQEAVNAWEAAELKRIGGSSRLVEKGYRVGTTAKQCLDALLRSSSSLDERKRFDDEIQQNLQGYLRNIH
jgi:glutamate formiminotransferase